MKYQQTIDHFSYPGYWNEGFCKVEIDGDTEFLVLVILTELPNNTGASITNCSEAIATKVVSEYQLPYFCCLFLEHYDNYSVFRQKKYAIVSYVWEDGVAKKPQWFSLSNVGFENLKQEVLALK